MAQRIVHVLYQRDDTSRFTPTVVAAAPPCAHLGAKIYTGEKRCGAKLHECALHGRCTTLIQVDVLRCCRTCEDHTCRST